MTQQRIGARENVIQARSYLKVVESGASPSQQPLSRSSNDALSRSESQGTSMRNRPVPVILAPGDPEAARRSTGLAPSFESSSLIRAPVRAALPAAGC